MQTPTLTTDAPRQGDQGTADSTTDPEEEAGLDLPAIRETIDFAKTGRLNPNPPQKIPKFSANRLKPFNRKAYKCNCDHRKDCQKCQNWDQSVETDHSRSYHRQYRMIKRSEESASVMTSYTRELQRENEQLKRQNEELQKKNDQLQKIIEQLSK